MNTKSKEWVPRIDPFNKSKRNIWLLPSDKVIGKTKSFVDYQNDATAKDIKLAS